MLRNPISFLFKLGKKNQSLQFRQLRQLSDNNESPSSPLPTSLMMLDVPVKSEQSRHSNQMSS